MSSRRTGAIVAGLFAGLIVLWWMLRSPAGERVDDPNGNPVAHGTSAPKKSKGWMPWFLGGGGGGAGTTATYTGPTIPVYVKVIDLAGEPVAGADVDAKADREEYETAGLDDEQYEAWSAAQDATHGDEHADSVEIDDDAPMVPVESGRTDRRGEYVVRLKPDVAVIFHARDGRGREGVSGTLYVYDPAIDAEDDWSEEGTRAPRDPAAPPARLEVTIEIAELSTLSGIVVDDRGRPIAGAEISLTSWSTTEIGDESLVVPADARGENGEIVSGADGRFNVTLRGSGAFDLEAHAKGFQLALEQAIQILPGRETVVNLTLLAAADVTGVVLGPDGEPVADARVLVQGEPTPGTFLSQEASTDEKGEFLIEELAPGRYVVAASHEGMRPTELWNVAAGGDPVTLRLTRGGSVHGEVIARTDALPPPTIQPPHEDVEPEEDRGGDWGNDATTTKDSATRDEEEAAWYGDVYLAHLGRNEDDLLPIATGVPRDKERESPSGAMDARGRYFAQVRLDPNGRGTFDVEGIPGGVYSVTVMIGTATARIDSVRVPDSGRTDVRVSIPDGSGGSISGTVLRQDGRGSANGTVFLYGGTLPSGLSSTVAADGRFTFTSVPPGEYRVHAMLGGPVEGAETPQDADSLAENMASYAPARAVVVPPGGGRVSIDLVAYPANEPMPPSVDDVITDGEVVDPGLTGDIVEEELPPLPDELWTPEVWIEEIDDRLVVTSAPPGPEGARLFGGDRVTSIDGTAVNTTESWEALELLYGAKGSICRITADRPATQSTITVSLPRTRKVGDGGGGEGY